MVVKLEVARNSINRSVVRLIRIKAVGPIMPKVELEEGRILRLITMVVLKLTSYILINHPHANNIVKILRKHHHALCLMLLSFKHRIS